ncbi:hypothetical protein [Polymorphobacter megasporae]|uniref:hypothetical protein n=1 Tax=Glacieibacterium megasporae TaxID=2835787 RepID=UPI001C1E1364|nr:hypothetical protein [Polymorphobacter megasporae]UAJ09718.1 hypothetical protein KTC28_15675 [Polymorphobacter megasporae]
MPDTRYAETVPISGTCNINDLEILHYRYVKNSDDFLMKKIVPYDLLTDGSAAGLWHGNRSLR